MTPPKESGAGSEPIVGADDWIGDIVKRSGVEEVEVREALAAEAVRPPAGWSTARHALGVRGVHFAGIKRFRDGAAAPFSFARAIQPGVTGFGTQDENDAGKSSLLHIILWAVRGRTDLQDDVRGWLRGVLVEVTVDDERMAVVFSVHDRRPRGRVLLLAPDANIPWDHLNQLSRRLVSEAFGVSNDARVPTPDLLHEMCEVLRPHVRHELAAFSSGKDMERVMDGIMLPRLGFEAIPSWAARREGDRIDDADGALGVQGWPTWSGALLISDPSVKVVLGEEKFAAVRLLQVYLGSPWAPVAATAQAYAKHLENRISVLQRQVDQAKTAHTQSLGELQREITEIDTTLNSLPSIPEPAELARLVGDLQAASAAYARAQEVWLEHSQGYGETSRLLETAEADVAALQEASLTRRFWHALKPTCCPRCDTDVAPERWAVEKAGRCSLCDSDLKLQANDELAEKPVSTDGLRRMLSDNALNVDALDDLTQARLAVLQLSETAEAESEAMDLAKRERDHASAALDVARTALAEIDTSAAERRHLLELRRAQLSGQLNERRGARISDFSAEIAVLERRLKILKAAEAASVARRKGDQDGLLAQVNEKLTAIGQHLGVRQLTRAELNGAGHMAVEKGGATVQFGKVNDGERLRLKIAVIAALLRVGLEAGVTRHPGLLILDSIGREEAKPAHVARMLKELVQLAEDIPGLQVILTSAHGRYLDETLDADHTYVVEPGNTLW
ncbi:hypothetical protein ACIGO8_33250 [Streptomyces sp. NPDC053493]|uniref:hypothetical protein n=1 Tax=Streptomyces sp. NPDC053493 TaxID=3365705 RepID=UPI0037D08982